MKIIKHRFKHFQGCWTVSVMKMDEEGNVVSRDSVIAVWDGKVWHKVPRFMEGTRVARSTWATVEELVAASIGTFVSMKSMIAEMEG